MRTRRSVIAVLAVTLAGSLLGGAGLAAPAQARTPETPIGGPLLGKRGVVVDKRAKKLPKTQAAAFLVADADTGEVLAAKDAHGHHRPASTLKALTALTLIGKLDKKLKVKPSREACNVEGSAVGLKPQRIYTVDDLMLALMMVSGNDAAVALAEANGGVAATLRDMNAMARRLQAYDTVAKTPNGLDRPGQRSSAYDLALIARAGLADPDFRRYVSTKVADFPAPKGKTYQIANHNRLLWRYKGMIGVKNGWTSKALGSFVGAATRNGHTIIVVIMRHAGYFWNEVADLLDWGFAVRGKVTPVGRLVDPLPAATAGPSPTPSPPAVAGAPARNIAVPAPRADSGPPVVPVVIGAGLTGGLAWVGYGLYRRRRTAR